MSLPRADSDADRSDGATPITPDGPLLTYLIGRLDRAVRNRLNEVLAPYKLSIPQFTTLSVLKRRPGLSNAQLARRALIQPQSMIQVIVGLEARGLVQRVPDPARNRVLQTRLTDEGQHLLDQAEVETRELEAPLIAALDEDDDLEWIVRVMQRWANVLDPASEPPASG